MRGVHFKCCAKLPEGVEALLGKEVNEELSPVNQAGFSQDEELFFWSEDLFSYKVVKQW